MPSTLHRNQILESENEILAAVAQGSPAADVMNRIVTALEANSADVLGSILALDKKTQQLRVLTAPNLPHAYNEAVDGLKIGEGVGSCGTAAFRGTPVVVEDILDHPLWTDFKSLAEEHGLRACWSTPIMSSHQDVLGTFACYYKETKLPTDLEWELMNRLGHLAAIVMEREQHQQQLLEIKEIDHAIVENAPEAMIVFTGKGEIIKTNPKARELLGYDESEFYKISYSTLLAHKKTGTNQGLPFSFRTGETKHHVETLLKTKSKAQLLAELIATHLPNNRILVLIRDITNRSNLESNPAKDEKTQALIQMAACVAEELNQSLTSIMSHRDLLANHIASVSDVSSACTEPLRQILAAAKQAGNVTTQLANFSSQIPLHYEAIDLAPFLSNALLEFRDELGEETTIQFHVASGANKLYADGKQLKLALTQIVRAFDIKSVKEKTVTLSSRLSQTPENVVVTLEFKSSRLPNINTKKVFEPFPDKKVDSLVMGIGLSTAQSIVTQMSGLIDVEQTAKDTLEFRITLPSALGTHKVTRRAPSTKKPPQSQNPETILVCEDNEAIRLAIEGLLRASGYTVQLVENGNVALEVINQPEKEIAVLISDIRMPGITGKELASKVRKNFPDTQIILISGHTGGIVGDDWLQKEKIKFLPKPFTHAALIEAVSESYSAYQSLKSK